MSVILLLVPLGEYGLLVNREKRVGMLKSRVNWMKERDCFTSFIHNFGNFRSCKKFNYLLSMMMMCDYQGTKI